MGPYGLAITLSDPNIMAPINHYTRLAQENMGPKNIALEWNSSNMLIGPNFGRLISDVHDFPTDRVVIQI